MKKIIIILLCLFCSILYSQKIDRLSKITNDIVKLYIRDTLKTSFKNGDYIGINIYKDSISSGLGMAIETLDKDYKLQKKTLNYKWFTFQGKKIIVFCDLNSSEVCNRYFEKLWFDKSYSDNPILSGENTLSNELDGEIRPWTIFFNEDYKIVKIGGKLINAEIANPKDFKCFLKKFSNLKLYQMTENGIIVYPKPHK